MANTKGERSFDDDRRHARRAADNSTHLTVAGTDPSLAGAARYAMLAAAAALPLVTAGFAWGASEIWDNLKGRLNLIAVTVSKVETKVTEQGTAIAVQTTILNSLDKRVDGIEGRERAR